MASSRFDSSSSSKIRNRVYCKVCLNRVIRAIEHAQIDSKNSGGYFESNRISSIRFESSRRLNRLDSILLDFVYEMCKIALLLANKAVLYVAI